jgi:hypothetical protein
MLPIAFTPSKVGRVRHRVSFHALQDSGLVQHGPGAGELGPGKAPAAEAAHGLTLLLSATGLQPQR